jgi:hypothetical protein
MVKAIESDITSHFSQKPVLHFSYSNHYVFDYIYPNIFGLFRLLNEEHRMMFWYKKLQKNCSDIPLTLKNKTVLSSTSLPYSITVKHHKRLIISSINATCFGP